MVKFLNSLNIKRETLTLLSLLVWSALSTVQTPAVYVNMQTGGWLLVFSKSPAETKWWTEDIWFLPPACLQTHKHRHRRGFPVWFLDFPRWKGLPAAGCRQSCVLLSHFTGMCHCLLEVALLSVCFDTGSLVFTHRSDRLTTDRRYKMKSQFLQVLLSLSHILCLNPPHWELTSWSSLVVKHFSVSHLLRQIYPHSSVRVIIQGEESAKLPCSVSFLHCTVFPSSRCRRKYSRCTNTCLVFKIVWQNLTIFCSRNSS